MRIFVTEFFAVPPHIPPKIFFLKFNRKFIPPLLSRTVPSLALSITVWDSPTSLPAGITKRWKLIRTTKKRASDLLPVAKRCLPMADPTGRPHLLVPRHWKTRIRRILSAGATIPQSGATTSGFLRIVSGGAKLRNATSSSGERSAALERQLALFRRKAGQYRKQLFCTGTAPAEPIIVPFLPSVFCLDRMGFDSALKLMQKPSEFSSERKCTAYRGAPSRSRR